MLKCAVLIRLSMLSGFKKIIKLWHSKKIRTIFFGLLFFGLIFGAYSAIPYPYIEGADTTQAVNKVSFNAPITLNFSQSMNKESVEENFQIHPRLKGDLVWLNGKILEFYPEKEPEIGDRYKIVIESEAKNIYGKSFGSDVTMYFLFTGPPYVKFVSPYIKSDELSDENIQEIPVISSDQVITVMFDRPMHWLDNNEESDLLKIDPPVSGEYRFIGMSAFQFIPESWPTGMRFQLTVPSKIKARDGGETEDEFNWLIETSPLRIVETFPKSGEESIGNNDSLTIVFNQPIDLSQIQPGNNALIYPSNDVDADTNPKNDGFFNTEVTYGKDSQGITDKTTLVFKPTFPYLYDTDYKFVIKAGLSSVAIDTTENVVALEMKQDYELTFKTAQAPGVIDFTGPSNEYPNAIISFSTDMTVREILDHLTINPEPLSPITIVMSENNRDAEVLCKFAVNTDYVFELKAPLKDIAGNEIKNSFKETFRVKDPYQKLQWEPYGNKGIFAKDIDPEFTLKSKNINSINLELCQVSERNFIKTNENQKWEDYNCFSEPVPYKLSPDGGITLLNLSSIFKREFDSGVYYLSAKSGNYSKDENSKKIYKLFLVSDTTIVLKKSENSLLLWASDIITGEPVSRMELILYSYSGEEIGRGVTDGDGIYKITRDFEEGVYVVGKQNLGGESRWTIANDFWLNSEQNVSSSLNPKWIGNGELRAYLMSDKNVITAGDKIKMKGVLRVDNDAQFALPDESQIIVSIENDHRDSIIEESVSVRRNGSFDASIAIPVNVFSGNYSVAVYSSSGEKIDTNKLYVTINKGDSPFLMSWVNPKNDFFAHETASVQLKANYFVGIPASSLRGSWELYKKPHHFNGYSEGAFYSFGKKENILCFSGACYGDEEFVSDGEFSFDPDGFAQIVLADSGKSYLDPGNEYYLIATASSVSGNRVSKSLKFIVHPGNRYIGLSSKHYLLKQNESADFSVIVSDIMGKLTGNTKVVLSLIQIDGDSEEKTRYRDDVNVGTEPHNFSIPITRKIPEGLYKLKAESQDSTGNLISSELELYVINENVNPVVDDLAILMDQLEYYVGGKTRMLINYPPASSDNRVTALITYERIGVLGYRIVELESPLTEISIPIIKEMVPNMHISVTLIEQNPEKFDLLIQNQESRRKENENRQTEVEIILLEEELSQLKENKNHDLDEASAITQKIESLKNLIEDSGDNAESNADVINFIPTIKRSDVNVMISNPDQIINVEITPEPLNPNPGEEVKIKLYTYDYQNRPVSSVVSLNVFEKQMESSDGIYQTLYDYFLQFRSSQVFMSSNISYFDFSKIRNQSIMPNGSMIQTDEVSSSAYFNPLILTDESGLGEISFTLPDKHMTWQVDALATSEEANFGSESLHLLTKKRLSILPITPAFVIAGDRITITAKVQNLSDENVETAIELLTGDAEVRGGSKRSISIKPGETINVDWDVIIGAFYEENNFKIAFRSREDYVETNLPIKKLKTQETLGSSGIIYDEWAENIRTPQNAVKDMGNLSVSISATPISIARKYANALADTHLDSAEKLASGIISKMTILRPELSDGGTKTLIDEIQSIIDKLISLQKNDGGYGFFEGTYESNPWLTAYVTYSLSLVDDLFEVPESSKESGVRYLWSRLGDQSLPDKFFILWVLSELEEYDTTTTLDLFRDRYDSPLSGRAFLLMNIQNLIDAGQKSAQPFLERLQSEIVSEKITDDNWIYFEEEEQNSMDSNIRSTAIILFALSKLSDENPILMPIVEYLTSNATSFVNNFNPQEAVWLLLALTELTNQHKLNVNLQTEVIINNKTLIEESIQTEDVKDIYTATIPIDDLRGSDQINELEIFKEGSGELYFNSSLLYCVETDSILPVEENAVITRNYYTLEDFNEENPLAELTSGVLYKGVLTLVVSEDASYIAIENPLPAGLKALSFNPAVGNISMQYEKEESARANGLTWIDNPLWLFDNYLIEDDRMILYSENLPAGIYKIDYLVQAGMYGKYNHLPATVKTMFNSDMYGRTEGGWMKIK